MIVLNGQKRKILICFTVLLLMIPVILRFNPVKGFTNFKKAEGFRINPDFKAIRYEIYK